MWEGEWDRLVMVLCGWGSGWLDGESIFAFDLGADREEAGLGEVDEGTGGCLSGDAGDFCKCGDGDGGMFVEVLHEEAFFVAELDFEVALAAFEFEKFDHLFAGSGTAVGDADEDLAGKGMGFFEGAMGFAVALRDVDGNDCAFGTEGNGFEAIERYGLGVFLDKHV